MTEIMPFPKTIYCFIGPPLRAVFFYGLLTKGNLFGILYI